jgi:hypothetical protein
LAFVLFGSLAGSATAPAPASAYVNYYNCGTMPVSTWCLSDVRHHYYYNQVHRHDHFLCAKFIRDSGADYAAACGYENIAISVTCACVALRPLSQNGGPTQATIYGDAYF